MLANLLEGKKFVPIEPVAVLTSEAPASLNHREGRESEKERQATKTRKKLNAIGLGNELNCANAGNVTPRAFDGFQLSIGAPPYRIYRIREALNPFPNSTFTYWSEYVPSSGVGRDGYSWVDSNACEHSNGISAFTDSQRLRDDFDGQRSVLTEYEGSVVTWTVSRGYFVQAQAIRRKITPNGALDLVCTWAK